MRRSWTPTPGPRSTSCSGREPPDTDTRSDANRHCRRRRRRHPGQNRASAGRQNRPIPPGRRCGAGDNDQRGTHLLKVFDLLEEEMDVGDVKDHVGEEVAVDADSRHLNLREHRFRPRSRDRRSDRIRPEPVPEAGRLDEAVEQDQAVHCR